MFYLLILIVDALYNLGLATYMETEDADEAIQYFDKQFK